MTQREESRNVGYVGVHVDVAEKFVTQAIEDGASVPNPPEIDGAFRLALAWAYARMGGDVERF